MTDEVLGKAYDARMVRRLAQWVRPYRGLVALTLLLLAGVSAAQLAQPYLLKLAIDGYIVQRKAAGLLLPAGLFLAALAAEFVVDLTNEALFTQIHGSGTFEDALTGATNILMRHDLPPLTDTPDTIAGDVGIDHIQLLGPAPVEPRTWGEIKHLFQ